MNSAFPFRIAARMSGLAIISLVAGVIPYGLMVSAIANAVGQETAARRLSILAWGVLATVSIGVGPSLPSLVSAIAAIASGHAARETIRTTGKGGYTLATAGLFLGYLSILILVLTIVGSWILASFTSFGE